MFRILYIDRQPELELMMKHRLIALALASALALPTAVLAHEGHGEKKMGTITMAAPDHLMLKTADGKEVTIAVNAKTKVVKGKTAMKLSDLEAGTRIVATVATAKAPFTASEITVGATPAARAKNQ